LSSIVKAKLYYDVPQSIELNRVKCDYGSLERDRIINEINEKKEAIMKQAVKRAQLIEDEALKRADFIVESAIKNSQSIINEAQNKGYEEGYLRGLVDGANASENAAKEGLHEISRLVELMKSEQKEALCRQEEELVAISFEIAMKIMKQQVKIDENAIPKMLEEIIHENQTGLKISISEYQKTLDLRIDKVMAKRIRDTLKDAKFVFVKEEDNIMIETDNGIVDISVPVQIAQLKEALDHN